MKMKFATFRNSLLLAIVLSLGLFSLAFGQLPLDMQSETIITGDYSNAVGSGDYLYVSTTYGVAVFDISDPTDPEMVVHYGTEGECTGLALNEDNLYVADGYKGVLCLDVSDPANPAEVWATTLDGRARNLSFGDDIIFVAMEEDGIASLDLEGVTQNTATTIDRAVDIEYYDGYVYVSDNSTVRSYDTALTFIDSYGTAEDYHGLAALGDVLYVANDIDGVDRLSISAGAFTYIGVTECAWAMDVSTVGDYLAVALKSGGVMVMSAAGVIQDTYEDNAGDVMGVFGMDDLVYAAESINGLEIIDAAAPTALSLEGAYTFAGGPRNMVSDGTYAYIANHEGGLVIMDVSDPRAPFEVYNIEIDGWTYDVDIVGTYIYVVEFFNGVYVYDIVNPLSPVMTDSVFIGVGPDLGGTRACATDGSDYLIVVHYDYGIYKYDISTTPGELVYLGNADTDGHPRDVKVDNINDLAFVADYDDGCDIFDVSVNTPNPLSEWPMDVVRAVDFVDDVLFVGSEGDGMDIVDITDPSLPVLITNYATEGDVNGMVYSGDYVFLCGWTAGLEAVDVSDPTLPEQAGYFDTHSLGKAAFIDENLLYFADSYSFYIFAVGGAADVWLPEMIGEPGASVVIPITVSDLTGLGVVAWQAEILLDPAIITIDGYDVVGTISEPMIIAWNVIGDTLFIGGFETVAVSGSGVLINILATIDPGATVGDVTDLTFNEFYFNEGIPMAYTHDGWIEIMSFYTIDGNVNYYMGSGDPIEDFEMNMTGFATQTVYTDVNGYYIFESLAPEYYEVTPRKWNPIHISPFFISLGDAVMTAQSAVGIVTLTPNQTIAADVSGNGMVQFFDASYIAQYAVVLIEHFPVAVTNNTDWWPDPPSNTYDPLTGNVTDDYLGILYGEVTGNWFGTMVASNPIVDNSLIGEYELDDDMVTIPVMVNDNSGDVYFAQAEFRYDPELLEFQNASTTELTESWEPGVNFFHNVVEPGYLRVGGFSAYPLSGTGEVFNLTFKILDENSVIHLNMENYFIDEGGSLYDATITIGAPSSYALKQNYPNPFNPETTIRFDIKERGNVTLVIYNTLGQKVDTLVDEVLEADIYHKSFDGTDFASGIYFYQLKCNDFTDTKKMILIK